MATDEHPGGRSFIQEAVAALPAIWAGVIVVLSTRGILRSAQTAFSDGVPAEIAAYIQVGMAASLVQILGGIYLLLLAWRRSPRFAHLFTIWALFVIGCDIGLQAATLFIAAFTQIIEPWLMTGLFTAIGIVAIVIARRADTPAATAVSATAQASTGIVVFHGFLGFIVGGGLGLLLGFGVGALTVELLDVSCFEGGCGYAAVSIAFLVMIAGAIIGPIVAIRRVRRRTTS